MPGWPLDGLPDTWLLPACEPWPPANAVLAVPAAEIPAMTTGGATILTKFSRFFPTLHVRCE